MNMQNNGRRNFMTIVRCEYITGGEFEKQFKSVSAANKWIGQFSTQCIYTNFKVGV